MHPRIRPCAVTGAPRDLKTPRINVGHVFAQPYESDYAMWRRCLVANPGRSLSAIKQAVKTRVRQAGTTTERLRQLQLAPGLQLPLRASYRRQCPSCAQHLYHCDVYALPWLPTCPIHHCRLTTTCPTCRMHWPDLDELSGRDCPHCGRPSIAQLAEASWTPLAEKAQDAIGKLVTFITQPPSLSAPRLVDDCEQDWRAFGDRWWQQVPIDSPAFPAFQVHHQQGECRAWLKRLGVRVYPLSRIASNLTPVEPRDADAFCPELKRLPYPAVFWEDQKQAAERDVLSGIVGWIAASTPDNHHIHLTDYRHVSLQELLHGRGFCPYCLALSVWYFDIAAKRHGAFYARTINEYAFFEQCGFDGPMTVCAPVAVRAKQALFALDQPFALAMYRRGLEVAFVDLLRLAFAMLMGTPRWDGRRPLRAPTPTKVVSPRYTERRLSLAIVEDRLICYHEHPSALAAYVPPQAAKLAAKCRGYRRRYARRRPRPRLFDHLLAAHAINDKVIRRLDTAFRDYLDNGMECYEDKTDHFERTIGTPHRRD